MNKIISIGLGLVLIIGIGAFVYWQKQEAMEEQLTEQAIKDSQNQQPTGEQGNVTASAIAEHNNATSCWSSINGNVYDLTAWIPKHPGGPQAILQLCGIDGSAKFNKQHGGAALQAQVLAGFKIGTLTQ